MRELKSVQGPLECDFLNTQDIKKNTQDISGGHW